MAIYTVTWIREGEEQKIVWETEEGAKHFVRDVLGPMCDDNDYVHSVHIQKGE